ncbi:MAG: VOC family protein [Candidatus Melainabacteria bacterium]|nr:VOC family protein [Candidatus Melainabacteria bacterium]
MSTKADPIPKGYHTITPTLTCKNTLQAIEFYTKAFGAEKRDVSMSPDGKKVMHAEMKIGDSIFMLNDEFPEMGCKAPSSLGGSGASMWLYVDNVDTWFERATKSGAKTIMPVTDMFWGDRFGQVEDADGHRWSLATHIKDLTKEEIEKGQQEWAEERANECATTK